MICVGIMLKGERDVLHFDLDKLKLPTITTMNNHLTSSTYTFPSSERQHVEHFF
jgi:hypothetical protein